MEQNTLDSILEAFEKMGQHKGVPISAEQWLEGSAKLLALIGGEQDRLFELESVIAKIKADIMSNEGMTASKAKILIEARGEYLEVRKLKAKIERVFESIKLGKVMARMSMEEFKSN